MDHSQRMTNTLLALFALVSGSVAVACTAEVVTSGGDGGGSSSGSSSGPIPENDGGPGQPCVKVDDSQECGPVFVNASSGAWYPGTQTCTSDVKGRLTWSGCEGPSTPLVLSFDGAPVDFAASGASAAFDLSGGTTSVVTDWPSARTPWLALDRNGNGRIDEGGELFGSATRLASGGRAVNGFIPLRELDSNEDGRITPEDEAWPRLLLWSDRDGDRVSSAGELSPLSSRRLASIDLGYAIAPRCDGRGNCEVERAAFRYLDDAGRERTGEIVDVHLPAQ